jgi:hypothetical protein
MSKFERVLAVDSTELPDCRCSVEMHLIATMPVPGGGSEIRIFRCPDCNHELRLTVWHNDLSAFSANAPDDRPLATNWDDIAP